MDSRALFSISYGMYVLTAFDEANKRYTGCIVNTAVQITAEPPTVAVSVNHDNYTHGCIKKTGRFGLSVLSHECDPALIGRFGFASGRERDKLSDLPHDVVDNCAVLRSGCGYMVCEVIEQWETSTHTVFLGKLINAKPADGEPKKPLTYADYRLLRGGKSPKNAPTYQAEHAVSVSDLQPVEAAGPTHRCTVCQYLYADPTPFAQLPDDFRCPICMVKKDKFVAVE